MGLCHHEAALPDRLYNSIRTFLFVGRRNNNDVCNHEFIEHRFMAPRDCPCEVAHHPQRVVVQIRQDSVQAGFVDRMTKPQKIFTAAVWTALRIFERIWNDRCLFAKLCNSLLHGFCRASHNIRKPQSLGIVRPIEVIVAEIYNNPLALHLCCRHCHQFVGLWLCKYKCAGSQIIERCPAISGNVCPITPRCRRCIPEMDERNPVIWRLVLLLL